MCLSVPSVFTNQLLTRCIFVIVPFALPEFGKGAQQLGEEVAVLACGARQVRIVRRFAAGSHGVAVQETRRESPRTCVTRRRCWRHLQSQQAEGSHESEDYSRERRTVACHCRITTVFARASSPRACAGGRRGRCLAHSIFSINSLGYGIQ
jgi:hypothetical protein